jgi:nucleoside-diphosphate-sugar epimerase
LKKVLVTGGTGFLGSYIIQELVKKNYAVRAIRRNNTLPFWIPSNILEKVEWVPGDILDVLSLEDAMDGVDTVIHSAALVSFHKKDANKLYQMNVDGTANVVNTALLKNVSRFVHISSVAAIGRKAGGVTVDESAKWEESALHTHYAQSKFKAELQVWRGIGEGLNAVILNPSTILGFGDWHTSSCAIFKQIHDGFNWYTDGLNGFVDVQDVARATITLMESTIQAERFIINGDNWKFRQLQNEMAEGFGVKKPGYRANALLLGIAWRLEWVKSFITGNKPLLTKESARVARSETSFSNEKIKKALPDFQFTPLAITIKEACQKYKSH